MRLPRLTIATILPALVFAAPAIAKDKKPQDPNKKVCRSEVPTGSMFGKSVCHTNAEWQVIDDQNRAAADSTISSSNRGSAHN